MSFEPKPGTRIHLNGEAIEFISLDSTGPGKSFVYAESGKEGTVYKVLKGKEFYALKVLYPEYRDKRLLRNTEKLRQFKGIEGLKVTDRTVITRQSFPSLVSDFEDLEFSILMPWIDGILWANLMISENQLKAEMYIQIAKLLMRVMCGLESQGIAHCDMSNNNFIINPGLSSVELIDIEDMFAPDMPRPIPTVSYGTEGYRTAWIAENGLWSPESDRFACAILCAEILAWHNKDVRDSRAGSSSFFDEEEIGESSDRFRLISHRLKEFNPTLPALFQKAWNSKRPDQCPAICEWMNALNEITTVREDADVEQRPQTGKAPIRKETHAKNDVSTGAPPNMEISHSILNFGDITKIVSPTTVIVKNSGGSLLEGTISHEEWLDISQNTFMVNPGEQQNITVSLKPPLPASQSKYEYRSPGAIVFESNGKTEVVGVTFTLPTSGFIGARISPTDTISGKTGRKRGGCLTAWLALAIIGNALLGLISFVSASSLDLAYQNNAVLLFVSGLLSLLSVVFAIAIYQWKKYGVYGYGACICLAAIISLAYGSATAFFQALIPLGFLIFLVRPLWDQFDS